MEILQAVWTALTNENQLAQIITSIPMTFIEASLVFLLFTQILNITFTRKQAIIYVVSFSLFALLTPYLIPAPFYTFINVVAIPLLVYYILKTNALKAILAEIVVYVSVFVIITPLISTYTAVFNVTSTQVSAIPIYKMSYSVFLYLIMFIVYKLLKKFNVHITYFDKFDNFTHNILIMNFIIGTLAVAFQAYIQCFYIDFLPHSLVYTSLVVLVIYFCISLFSLFRSSKLEQTKQLLDEEKMYNKTLNTLHDNIRVFKHDFNNIIQAVGGYISTNNIDGLKVYYKDLLEECQINTNLSVLNPEIINNPAIYSLLADKYYKSEELNIKMNIEVFMDLSNLHIKIFELTRILGVLLDNAIEAASKCNEKVVNITFRKDKNRNQDLIIVQNTYTNKDVNIDRIFEKGYTSKKINEKDRSHGLGLWEVRKYLKKNTNLDLYTTKNDKFFTQQFEICN